MDKDFTKRRQRALTEMVYFKGGYVQDLEDMVERLKKEIEELKASRLQTTGTEGPFDLSNPMDYVSLKEYYIEREGCIN